MSRRVAEVSGYIERRALSLLHKLWDTYYYAIMRGDIDVRGNETFIPARIGSSSMNILIAVGIY